MTSTEIASEQWHVRRQRPDARTTLLTFIDADADRMTCRQFLDRLEGSQPFRELFVRALLDCGPKAFVIETKGFNPAMLGDELELAVIEPPPPTKKVKLNPAKLSPDLLSEQAVVVISEGESVRVAPSAHEAEGWYADLGVFLRRVRRAQAHALWRMWAQEAKKALATDKVWLSSSAPGAPWLHLRVDRSPEHISFGRFKR